MVRLELDSPNIPKIRYLSTQGELRVCKDFYFLFMMELGRLTFCRMCSA